MLSFGGCMNTLTNEITAAIKRTVEMHYCDPHTKSGERLLQEQAKRFRAAQRKAQQK
jgi:hypothetical protein